MPLRVPAGMRDTIARVAQPTGAGEYVRRHVVARLVNARCPSGGRVVDLGAGAGNLYGALRVDLRTGYTVVDVEPGSYGRRIIGDVTAVPVAADCADCVCLSDVLEHLTCDAEAVQEAVRIVRPGGHIVIHVPSTRIKPYGFLQRAADGAEEVDHQRFPHVRDGYTGTTLSDMLNTVAGANTLFITPSFTAAQSLLSDLDACLWWHKWTPLRVGPWLGIRLSSLRNGHTVPSASSSGYLAVLRKEAV